MEKLHFCSNNTMRQVLKSGTPEHRNIPEPSRNTIQKPLINFGVQECSRMFRCSSVLVLVLAIQCILSWCSRFGLKIEHVNHVRFPNDFLLRCLLDFELARKLLQAGHTTILDSSNERFISRLPKHENEKNVE